MADTGRGRWLRAITCAVVAATSITLIAPDIAQAGVGFGVVPDLPNNVTVGQSSVATSITIGNVSDGQSIASNILIDIITFVPSCGTQVISGADCPIASADPGVFLVAATGTGRASTACATLNFTITKTDALQDKYSLTPSAPFTLGPASTFPASSCVVDFTMGVLKAPGKDASAATGLQTNPIAFASGVDTTVGQQQSGQRGGGLGTDITTVALAVPTIATTATGSGVIGTAVLSDSATVSGRVAPVAGGMVTFSLYGPDNATCAGAPVFTSTVSHPVGGGPVSSAAFTPTLAGTYRWIAAYSGDVNNQAVTGVCNDANESVVVGRATPSIATTASGGGVIGAAVLADSAVVSGRVGPLAGGTVTFTLFGPNDANCTGVPVFTDTVSYPVGGGAVSPATFTPTLAGTYRWTTAYSGDANNQAVSGPCNAANESVVVTKAQPSIATTATGGGTIGTAVLSDSATVSGRIAPVAGATITFELYGPNDATCSGTPVFISIAPQPIGAGAVISGSYTPTQVGTYRWTTTYSGDANNLPVSGPCNAADESVDVTPTTTTTSTTTTSTTTTTTTTPTPASVATAPPPVVTEPPTTAAPTTSTSLVSEAPVTAEPTSSIELTVPENPPTGLPATGQRTDVWLFIGVASVLIGLLLVRFPRRRSSR